MPQINSTIPENLVKELQEIAKNNNKSFSKVVCEIIELGLKLYDQKDNLNDQKSSMRTQELEAKHTEYLLRTMAIVADILRCTCNEKSKYANKEPEEILEIIKGNVDTYIENCISGG